MERDFVFQIRVLVILQILLVATSNARTISYVSANVSFNREYFDDYHICLDDAGAVDIIMNTSKDYTQDPWAAIAVIMKMPKQNRQRILLEYNVNICTVLGKPNKGLISMWIQNYFKHGNIPKTCPMEKGNYSWLGMKPDMLNIPQFFANGQYISKIDIYFRNKKAIRETLANISMTIQIV